MVERVLRLRSRQGAEAKAASDSAASRFYHPNGVAAAGTRKVDDEVFEHLSVPPRAFLDALNIRQGELRRIVELRGVERGQYLDRLIGISSLEDCYARASELESWSKLNLAGAEMKEKSLQEETRSIADIEASLEVAKEQVREVSALLEAKRVDLAEVRQRVQQLQALQVKLVSVEAELKPVEASLLRLQGYLEESRKALRELEEAEREKGLIEAALTAKPGYEERRARLEQDRKALLASFTNPDSLRKDLEVTESRLREASKEVEELPSKLAELDMVTTEEAQLEADYSRYGEVSKSYEEFSGRHAGLRAELGNLETTLRNLNENVDRNCPTCLQPITAEYAKRASAQLTERVHVLEAGLVSLGEDRSAMRLEKERLEEEGSRLRKTAVRAEALRGMVESLRRRMDEVTELERRRAELEIALKRASGDQEELRRLEGDAQAITGKLGELERSLGRLDDINERLAGKGAVEERVRRLSEELEGLELKAGALRVEVGQLRESFNEAELDHLTRQQDSLSKEVVGLAQELGSIEGRASGLAERLRELS